MFGYQLKTYETTLDERAGYWACGEGLQAADGLSVSAFGRELGRSYIAGRASSQEICEAARRHYDDIHDGADGTREADIVACRITAMVERADRSSFVLSARTLAGIHGALFAILYLNALGLPIDNEIFRDNSLYFRDCLVRASYTSIADDVLAGDSSFIEDFFYSAVFGGELRVDADALVLHGLDVAEDELMAYRVQEDYLEPEREDSSLRP